MPGGFYNFSPLYWSDGTLQSPDTAKSRRSGSSRNSNARPGSPHRADLDLYLEGSRYCVHGSMRLKMRESPVGGVILSPCGRSESLDRNIPELRGFGVFCIRSTCAFYRRVPRRASTRDQTHSSRAGAFLTQTGWFAGFKGGLTNPPINCLAPLTRTITHHPIFWIGELGHEHRMDAERLLCSQW